MNPKLNAYPLALSAAASLLWMASHPSAMAQTPPVGTWDCLVSGKSQGIAFIQFSDDNTLNGYTLLTQTPKSAPVDDGRSNTGTRGDTPSTQGPSTNWFGILSIEGQWLNLGSGKILGTLAESGFQLTAETNDVVSTNFVFVDPNLIAVITTNMEISYSTNFVTNAFSFTGKASAKKIVLKTTGVLGDRVLSGKPVAPITDLSGNYYAIGTSGSVSFVEFLTLTPSAGFNAYDISGSGSGYTVTGALVQSDQKRVGLVLFDGGSVLPKFAVTGPVNTKKFTADLKGTDEDNNLIRYKLYKQP